MQTISTEYYKNLYRIQQDDNLPSLALLVPSTENIYEVDLNKRVIEAPEYLSVWTDHQSEVIYFKCDRFFDYMDLSTTTVIIQYKNAKGESRIYPVPFVDIATCSLENKMLIPWCVDGNVTAAAGEVTFSITFYKIDIDGQYIVYKLSTLPAKSKILEGQNVQDEDGQRYLFSATEYEYINQRIDEISNHRDVDWIVLT